MKDYYSILGLTDEEKHLQGQDFQDACKKKYHACSLKWHPDRWANGTDEEKKTAEDKFKDIAEAYEVLSDPQKRAQYDNPNSGFEFQGGIDPMDIFRRMQENMRGGFGSSFFDGFPGFGGGRNRVKKGEDINASLVMTLEEAYHGGEKEVTVETYVDCPHCHGTGSEDGRPTTCPHCNGSGMYTRMQQMGVGSFSMSTSPCPHCHGTGKIINNPCRQCHGSGKVTQTEKRKVEIPAGLSDGMTIILQGMGQPIEDGINGDMAITIHILDDPYFVRADALNLIHYESVPFNEALLGFKKKFKCIDGSEVTVNAPELTPHGKAFIFKGKGMPDHNFTGFGGYGDYAVVINHELPTKLTKKQKEMLKNFND